MNKQAVVDRWMNETMAKYQDRMPRSRELYEYAQKYLPGGDTRSVMFFKPYPAFIARGEGCKLYDVDGNVYLDFLNNYTSLVHGHAHPAIVKAAIEQVQKGTVFPGPTESQCILGEMICNRVKSVEQIRFVNTGTEATMMAIRTARIVTGKSKVVKTEGGYHGTHESAEVSVYPSLEQVGPIDKPVSVPNSRGIPKSVCEEVIIVPFNNKTVTEKRIREYKDEIACVIVEPMQGSAGLFPEVDGYLKFLRDLTHKLNIILIFDEVITFRLGLGGLQGILGIEPDLTTFGKIIGGGFPVGAFGGKKEIMMVFAPGRKGYVPHSGTFNGNPMTMTAGIACLKELTGETISRINLLGESLAKGTELAFKRNGINGQATGIGSLQQPQFNAEEIVDYRSALKGNFQAMALMHLKLLEKGIYIAPRGECALSTPMTEKEIMGFVSAFEECLAEIKPFIEATSPNLIV